MNTPAPCVVAAERLRELGFQCTDLPFGEVSNFWAVRGEQGPILVFAGHTDVERTAVDDLLEYRRLGGLQLDGGCRADHC